MIPTMKEAMDGMIQRCRDDAEASFIENLLIDKEFKVKEFGIEGRILCYRNTCEARFHVAFSYRSAVDRQVITVKDTVSDREICSSTLSVPNILKDKLTLAIFKHITHNMDFNMTKGDRYAANSIRSI